MRVSFRSIVRTINMVPQLKIGLILLTFLVLMALFAPALAPFRPMALESPLASPPSRRNPLGTDGLGRDLLSMMLYGARTSLLVGIVAATISGVIGTLLGGFAGYYGGTVDAVLNETINIFLMMPSFFLILIIVALFGSSMLRVMVVIGLTSWTGNARLMRAQAMSLRERTFVKAAVAVGESKPKILFTHIIPNGIFPIIPNTTMQIAGSILTEASLSFLGLGDPNIVSWGQIVYNGKSYLSSAWWISTVAGFGIVLTVLAFYLIGDGLNKVINPKQYISG